MSKRRRRRPQAKPAKQPAIVQPSAAEIEAARAAAIAEYEPGNFEDVEDYEVGVADERSLMLLMRDWRKGRATRSIWDAITNGYNVIFAVLVIGAMLVGGIMEAQNTAAGCTTTGCNTAKSLVPWLLVCAMTLLAISLSKIFGPVVASAAEGSWLLDAPIRRSRILRKRLVGVLALSFFAAGALTLLICVLLGLSLLSAAIWGVAAGLGATAATAFAASQQGRDSAILFSLVQGLLGTVSTVVLLAVIAVSVGWIAMPLDPETSLSSSYAMLGVAAVVLVIFAVIAFGRLNRLRRARLVSGGDLLSGMQGAAFALDFSLMRDILVERKYLARGHVKPKRGKGIGTHAVVWRDTQRLLRNPINLIVLLVSAVIPYATEALGMGVFGVLISALMMLFVMIPFFDSLRVLTRTKGLARAFPIGDSELRSSATVVPAALAFGWAVMVTPAFLLSAETVSAQSIAHSFLLALITAGTGYVAAIRWVSARPPDYSAPMLATGMGALPTGMIVNLLRGFDIVAVTVLPLVFGLSPWISVVILVIAYFIARSGGMNTQEMMERQAEAKKELEEAKANSTAERKVISRSGRKPGTPRGYTIGEK